MNSGKEQGKVYLVGAGPGDPGLLTIKALMVLKKCDIIIYDALMNPEILNLANSKAEKIYIGDSRTEKRIKQREVENLMIKSAREGKMVVRLKGGDPFMFGRGGEEVEALTREKIQWESVPGISAGIAASSYACIPLTHRDSASSVTFITGHESENKNEIEWDKIRKSFNTLVIYMGITRMTEIVNNLLKSDYDPHTPVAVIESGTTEKQKIRTSTLEQIVENSRVDPIKTPALIVIGDAVKYREKFLTYFSMDKFDYSKISVK